MSSSCVSFQKCSANPLPRDPPKKPRGRGIADVANQHSNLHLFRLSLEEENRECVKWRGGVVTITVGEISRKA
jgi:hypothetical protein